MGIHPGSAKNLCTEKHRNYNCVPNRVLEMIMDYVTVRELREKSGAIWQRVEAGEEFVVTRNGKPFAVLLHTQPNAVERTLRAHRAARFGEVLDQLQAQARASGSDQLTDDEIEDEIKAARSEQLAAAKTPPKAVPSARRH